MGDSGELSSNEAQQLYAALDVGDWHDASRLGLYLAMKARMEQEAVQLLYRAERRAQGHRASKNKPMPDWVKSAYAGFSAMFEMAESSGYPLPPAQGFELLMLNSTSRYVTEQLVFGNAVESVQDLSGEARALFDSLIMPAAREQHSKLVPRKATHLTEFFRGTRIYFYVHELGEPTARQLALLAAACGVEPIDAGLRLAVKHWEERRGRWRRDMDTQLAGWQEQMPAA